MKIKLFLPLIALIFICDPVWAQKPKSTAKKPTTTLSNAEKMGYARTNKYWGPGTYYSYAPGKPNNKIANNAETAMRDLIGISDTDLFKELAKQSFTEIPKKESAKTWFNNTTDKKRKYFYSSDKSYIIEPSTKDMYKSPVMENGEYAFACNSVTRWVLIPKEDTAKVMEAVWQYLRDLNESKVLLLNFRSDYKNADPKAYPIQRAGTDGWTGLRAGSWALQMVDGKPKGYWESNEDILRRTLGKPGFELLISGVETDFGYGLRVKLQKEGYVLSYEIVGGNLAELEPSNNWTKEHLSNEKVYTAGVKMDKDNVTTLKNAPFPPVLKDLNKVLHIK